MTLLVHTAFADYLGPDRLDVSPHRNPDPPVRPPSPFAPSWAISALVLAKRAHGDDVWPEHRAAYQQEMRDLYCAQRSVWVDLLSRETVTLVCYCWRVAECHRGDLAEILVKLGAQYLGDRTRVVKGRAPERWTDEAETTWCLVAPDGVTYHQQAGRAWWTRDRGLADSMALFLGMVVVPIHAWRKHLAAIARGERTLAEVMAAEGFNMEREVLAWQQSAA